MSELFISDENDLNLKKMGGVQKCSTEYINLINDCDFELKIFKVNISSGIVPKIKRKLNIDAYDLYNVKDYKDSLKQAISNIRPKFIFINNLKLLRFSKLVRDEIDKDVVIVFLSHGNESGDFLHKIVRSPMANLKRVIMSYRMGLLLRNESFYKENFVDGMFVLSEQEIGIEQWMGVKKPFLIPRTIYPNFIEWNPHPRRVGFVGSLDHLPNFDALIKILDYSSKVNFNFEFRIVGGPEKIGKQLAKDYDIVSYMGRLNDEDLRSEMQSWCVFLNPVFFYSRGASTKLAEGIGAGIPVLSTTEGARGYVLPFHEYLNCYSIENFVQNLITLLENRDHLEVYRKLIMNFANNGFTTEMIKDKVQEYLVNLSKGN